MRNKILILGVIFLILSFLVGSVNAAEKFGYVDLSRIFSEYNKTKDYDKALSNKEGVAAGELDKKATEIKQLEEKMNLLSDKEKEVKKSEMETKIKAFQTLKQQKEMDLRKEQGEKMKEILKDIEETVKQYAEKEGYTLIFNDRVLVYQLKSLDVTDKILDSLNKSYKK
jgi:outer membrane protein